MIIFFIIIYKSNKAQCKTEKGEIVVSARKIRLKKFISSFSAVKSVLIVKKFTTVFKKARSRDFAFGLTT